MSETEKTVAVLDDTDLKDGEMYASEPLQVDTHS